MTGVVQTWQALEVCNGRHGVDWNNLRLYPRRTFLLGAVRMVFAPFLHDKYFMLHNARPILPTQQTLPLSFVFFYRNNVHITPFTAMQRLTI